MTEPIKMTQEELNNEYSKLCLQLGDALTKIRIMGNGIKELEKQAEDIREKTYNLCLQKPT